MTVAPKAPYDATKDRETTARHFTYDAWNRLCEVYTDNAGAKGTRLLT